MVVVGGIIWVSGSKKSAPVSGEPIKIGALLILSGDFAAWGENAKKGIDLALEDFRKDHPENNIQIIYEDTKGDAKLALSGFKKLTEVDHVDAIIGPLFSTEVAALAPIVKDSIPVVTPSYAPLQNRPNPWNPLMVWMDPRIEARHFAQYIFDSGVRHGAIIGTLDTWEKEGYDAFVEEFEKLGGTFTDKEIVQPETSDVKLEITKIVKSKPEAVFVATYYQFVNSLKSLKDLGYPGKLYGAEVDSYLADQTKNLSDGLQFIAPDFYTSDFVTEFNNRFNEKPGIPAGQAYDAANILFSFVTKYKNTTDILQVMSDFKKYNGVSGQIEVTPEQRIVFPTAIFELRNGDIVRLQSI